MMNISFGSHLVSPRPLPHLCPQAIDKGVLLGRGKLLSLQHTIFSHLKWSPFSLTFPKFISDFISLFIFAQNKLRNEYGNIRPTAHLHFLILVKETVEGMSDIFIEYDMLQKPIPRDAGFYMLRQRCPAGVRAVSKGH